MSNTKTPEFFASPRPSNTYNERDQLVFDCSFYVKGAPVLRCEWRCGNGVPLSCLRNGEDRFDGARLEKQHYLDARHAFRITVDAAQNRAEVRRRYRPSMDDVLDSLLLDDNSIEGCADCWDWFDELGAEPCRERAEAYSTIVNRRRPLRQIVRALGLDWNERMQEACER